LHRGVSEVSWTMGTIGWHNREVCFKGSIGGVDNNLMGGGNFLDKIFYSGQRDRREGVPTREGSGRSRS